MTNHTESTIEKLNQILNFHEKFKKAFFFKPPIKANDRRDYEEKNQLTTEVEVNGKTIKIEQYVTCTCRNIYYYIRYFENGNRVEKNISFVKKLMAA